MHLQRWKVSWQQLLKIITAGFGERQVLYWPRQRKKFFRFHCGVYDWFSSTILFRSVFHCFIIKGIYKFVYVTLWVVRHLKTIQVLKVIPCYNMLSRSLLKRLWLRKKGNVRTSKPIQKNTFATVWPIQNVFSIQH